MQDIAEREGLKVMWEYAEKGRGGKVGWFPMHDWIADELEVVFNRNSATEEDTKVRLSQEGVIWKYDLRTMAQRRIREGQDECTRSIRRIFARSHDEG